MHKNEVSELNITATRVLAATINSYTSAINSVQCIATVVVMS